ncbi:hypothetical protein [Parasphingorhabdus sp.]|uniref:hypothetical protein n=1 Tax=Parasphingorhabdus sp. TaxID=2709688 RepID=UPI00326310F1
MRTEFTGKELEKSLNEGVFSNDASQSIVAMVAPSGRAKYIKLSLSNCKSWVETPTAIIKQAKMIRRQSCGDHNHPIMEIELEKPSDDIGKTVVELLRSLSMRMPEAEQKIPNEQSDDLPPPIAAALSPGLHSSSPFDSFGPGGGGVNIGDGMRCWQEQRTTTCYTGNWWDYFRLPYPCTQTRVCCQGFMGLTFCHPWR